MDLVMGFSKTEVNLRRLLAAAPQQQNQAKLIHVSFLSSQHNSQKVCSKHCQSYMPGSLEAVDGPSVIENPSKRDEETHISPSPGLRRRLVPPAKAEARIHETTETDPSMPVKLDALAQAHIEKHRKLQEDLTDEMVGLAQQLKESSLMMNRSLQDTEKILDSTEKAVEHSLASTSHTNARAVGIYSETSKTTCFTWLIIFFMTCIFIMVVLLIRVT
ncbi:hypothetical protein HHK36_029604 [Tetracentron sinense]|uniref:USE1-like protein n=1 Tax=Tetracentron sinense TaxID=13715 RepID=A0A835CZW3_TETSI|nr:hypothetical protein HHK36_029604 [Tetracentron sinense]